MIGSCQLNGAGSAQFPFNIQISPTRSGGFFCILKYEQIVKFKFT